MSYPGPYSHKDLFSITSGFRSSGRKVFSSREFSKFPFLSLRLLKALMTTLSAVMVCFDIVIVE